MDELDTKKATFFTRLTENKDGQSHAHAQHYEIFYIIEGEIDHVFNRRSEHLVKGALRILRPNDTHYFRRKQQSCIHRDILIPIDLFHETCDFIDKNLFSTITNDIAPTPNQLSDEQIQTIENYLIAIKYMKPSYDSNSLPLQRSMLSSLLGSLYLNVEKLSSAEYPEWLMEFLDRFNETQYLKAGLSAIVADSFYTRIYLCRAFKKYIGMTMTDYLNFKRLSLAENYLVGTNFSVMQIAEMVGFNNLAHFNKLFKQKNNITPLKYRKMYFVTK